MHNEKRKKPREQKIAIRYLEVNVKQKLSRTHQNEIDALKKLGCRCLHKSSIERKNETNILFLAK